MFSTVMEVNLCSLIIFYSVMASAATDLTMKESPFPFCCLFLLFPIHVHRPLLCYVSIESVQPFKLAAKYTVVTNSSL